MTSALQAAFERGLAAVPADLRASAAAHWAGLATRLTGMTAEPDWAESAARVLAVSEFVARTCEAQPEVLTGLVESGDLRRVYAPDELRTRMADAVAACADETQLKQVLRRLRAREMVRIAWRDIAGHAELAETLATLSQLAEACIAAALARLYEWAAARDGVPRADASNEPARFVVLGMGKLGGAELNFSSDIDLIFAYSDDGATDKRGLSNHEFFVRLGQKLINALHEATADGFVFRVDMRLRPNGASGPLAISFDAMEQYYQAHGRTWERYAFIKARAVAGDAVAGAELLARLKPFIYRRYLDYSSVEEIRSLKATIHRELLNKGNEGNIKLGPGGIREVEFIGQAFQLIRGGRDTRLQTRAILPVLAHLVETGDLTAAAYADLVAAYSFLRFTENRLQQLHDQQTQMLPVDATDRLRLAYGLGFENREAFEAMLARHRQRVHEHFESVFAAPQTEAAPAEEAPGLQAVWLGTLNDEVALEILEHAGFSDAPGALERLRQLRASGAWSALSAQGRERLDKLMPLLLAAAALTRDNPATLTRLLALVESIGRRSVYFSLLVENPLVLSQLVKLCAASEWVAQVLSRHPILLDELMDPVALRTPLTRDALAAELQARLARAPQDDLEAQMELLREFRHGHVLRVAAADLGSGLTPAAIGGYLSDIAEVVVTQALELAQNDLVQRHGRPCYAQNGETVYPGFAVIAYGKLGSRELGYTSDLDMVFLYATGDEPGQTDGARSIPNEQFFARLGQRLIHVLTARTHAGILYEVDTRLRPSGSSGMLVTHPAAFRDYQRSHAWVWEHQALIRARPIAGDAALAREFEEIRAEILCQARDPAVLRNEVQAMRQRMHAAQSPHDPGQFNLKHDPGGMIDVEFMVQYAVLRWAHDHPGLIRHRDNLSLLGALQERGCVESATANLLQAAYRHYLGAEQRLKLMERKPLVERNEAGDFPEQVVALWQKWFEN
jgi:glutamate-ammonia-ligase adenylyltransferase